MSSAGSPDSVSVPPASQSPPSVFASGPRNTLPTAPFNSISGASAMNCGAATSTPVPATVSCVPTFKPSTLSVPASRLLVLSSRTIPAPVDAPTRAGPAPVVSTGPPVLSTPSTLRSPEISPPVSGRYFDASKPRVSNRLSSKSMLVFMCSPQISSSASSQGFFSPKLPVRSYSVVSLISHPQNARVGGFDARQCDHVPRCTDQARESFDWFHRIALQRVAVGTVRELA